jgi:hypothetical protein
MELLLGAITAILIQAGKKLVDRFGRVAASAVILGTGLLLSIAFTLSVKHGIITAEQLTYAATIWASSVATYEIILKRLRPIYDQIFKAAADQSGK